MSKDNLLFLLNNSTYEAMNNSFEFKYLNFVSTI